MSMSTWTETTSSVPQGSVLGPILFLIYINDLQRVITSDLSMFADDTKVFRVIKDKSSDRVSLQEDINAMQQWSKDWLMEFNIRRKVQHSNIWTWSTKHVHIG